MCDAHVGKPVRVFATIPAELHELLQVFAEQNGLKMSAVVQMALKRFADIQVALTQKYRNEQ